MALTHADRVLWPDPGITKAELASYLLAAAPRMLPQVAGRALNLLRAPGGLGAKAFFQQHPWSGAGPRLTHAPPSGEGRPVLAIRGEAGLVALAQFGVMEIHTWGARLDDPDRPDRLVLDLDPAEGLGFPVVVATALELRERLAALGLTAFCKATGGKGLHLVVPLLPRAGWEEVRTLARSLGEALARRAPERFTLNPRKDQRAGRVYLDVMRNARGAMAVAPFSPRARPGAPLALPLDWAEIEGSGAPPRITLRGAEAGYLARPDPWEGFADAARPVTPALLRRAEAG